MVWLRKKIQIFLFFLLTFPLTLQGGDPTAFVFSDSRSMGMGGISTVLEGINNVALPTDSLRSTLRVGYLAPYMVGDLSKIGVGFFYPNRRLNAGLLFSYKGFSAYHEILLSLHLDKQLLPWLFLGCRIDYFAFLASAEKGYRGMVTAEVGLQIRPLKSWRIGLRIINPMVSSITDGDNIVPLPVQFVLGTGYSFYPDLWLAAELDKEIGSPLIFRIGASYWLQKQFAFRIGLSVPMMKPSFGFGWKYKKIGLDTAFDWHPQLGVSIGLDLSYSF